MRAPFAPLHRAMSTPSQPPVASVAEHDHEVVARAGSRSALWALCVAAFWLQWSGFIAAWFMLRNVRLAGASAADLWRFLRNPQVPRAPKLRRVGAGVLAPVAPEATAEGPVVLYFTGTGETPAAMFEDMTPLTRSLPSLAGAQQYVLEPPENAGAYLNAQAFGEAMWECVRPLVERHGGPFVLVGMSRGGVAALDCGARIVSEQGKVASVLALSAPLRVPARLPPIVRVIAAIEPALARFAEAVPFAPRVFVRFMERCLHRSHLWFAALILRDLHMLAPAHLEYVHVDLAQRGAVRGSLRPAREFRLLQLVEPREAELFASDVMAVAAAGQRFFVTALWGALDSWVSAADSRDRLAKALEREPRAAPHVILDTIPHQGHALFRADHADIAPIQAAFEHVVAEAVHRAGQQVDRRRSLSELERRAREDRLGFGDIDG